ncbi:RHS repeat protein [Diaphorobacter aerolatus]|uniref:RHS repeat protein n=1 Tax=Diaphorobacter aerolatus TaxID=1288495 RepID=A0A7H0GGY1_9BURK|nr:RHS repeat protein [Diaphorobacter aerolatus]QNP47547.1 RHS repeat protein [Diaphorobacter aerolatus]
MGQLTSVIDALGNAVRYSYNETGTLAAVTHADGGVERFAYDAADRLIAYADPLGNITEYTLSPDGRPLARRNAEGGELRYEYDEALRLLTLHNENNASYDFSYDVLDRLTEETGFDGRNTQYRYDRTGLILAKLENGCLTAAQRLEKRLEREAQVGGSGDASVPAQRTTPTMDDPWGLGLADETAPSWHRRDMPFTRDISVTRQAVFWRRKWPERRSA